MQGIPATFAFTVKILFALSLNLELDWIHGLIYGITSLFCLFFILQVWHFLSQVNKVAKHKKSSALYDLPPVSVVVCAKNEDDNLVKFLPKILSQDYPNYEVVVVNDCSYDNTGEILEEFAKKHKNLKIVTIKEDEHYYHGKKFAVMCGIKGATNDILIFTDADCYPSSVNWLKEVANNYDGPVTEIVLGYGAFEKLPGLLNKLIRFDCFNIALTYFSLSLSGNTYMGVGRNLSYRKNLFFKHKGFASHYFIESGDDDLFINEAATKVNTKVEFNKEAFTYSTPKITFKGWFRQKRRHITTFKHYSGKSLRALGYISFINYGFWISFIAALTTGYLPMLVIGLYLIRLLVQLLVYKKAMERLEERDLLLLSPLFELILLLIYPTLSLSNSIIKRQVWKS